MLLSVPPPIERTAGDWVIISVGCAVVPQLLVIWLIFARSPDSLREYRFYLAGIAVSHLLISEERCITVVADLGSCLHHSLGNRTRTEAVVSRQSECGLHGTGEVD